MRSIKNYAYIIDPDMRDNWLGLFEEMQSIGKDGPAVLFAWFMGEQFLIEQSIAELRGLDEVDLNELPA